MKKTGNQFQLMCSGDWSELNEMAAFDSTSEAVAEESGKPVSFPIRFEDVCLGFQEGTLWRVKSISMDGDEATLTFEQVESD